VVEIGRGWRAGEQRNAYRLLVEKSGGKNHLEDFCICEGNIKTDVKEMGW
jgi:hypothetical protein